MTAVELGGTNINGFFGVNGANYWQSNGQPNTSVTNAYGLALGNLTFGLAILTPNSSANDPNVYYALQATVGQVQSVLPGSVPVSIQLGHAGDPAEPPDRHVVQFHHRRAWASGCRLRPACRSTHESGW